MPRSEEEVWRLPFSAKGEDVRLAKVGGSYRPLSSDAKARLARIARRTPEVMVKITGRARGIDGLKAHMDYVTRNGRLVAETQDGVPIADRAALRRLHDDWVLYNEVQTRGRADARSAQSVNIILSMPPGAPRDRVQDAARTWARDTFGDRHAWMMTRHDDREHPHVHVSVRAVGTDGKRLAPGPADLQQWRERFAGEMRRLGVEAEATPRQARGKVQRSEPTRIHQIERRGAQPRVRNIQQTDAAKDTRAPRLPEPRDWQHDIQARQGSIRRAYLAHAETLDQGSADDKRLASDIKRFVAEMPVPLTRRQKLATHLRSVLEQHPGRGPAQPPHATPLPAPSIEARVHAIQQPETAGPKLRP